MKQDPIENEFCFRAAKGWLELGVPAEAGLEIEQLPGEFASHPEVLKLRFHIERMQKRFPEALAVAEGLIALTPEDKWGWLYRSHALHWLGRSTEAYDLLAPKRANFPESYELPYDLACYCAQTGRIDEARTWLGQAFQLGDKPSVIRMMALDDVDLKPLWEDIKRGAFGKA